MRADAPLLLAACLGLLLGCAARTTPPAAEPGAPASESAGLRALVALGEKALAEGDVARAENRFERASRGAPAAASPRIGLARVALARGDPEQARAHAEAALERAPGDPDALTLLATTRLERGTDEARQEARELLERALAREPGHVAAHARRRELTGPAPRRPAVDTADALRLAQLHPYDASARLRAARRLAAEGRVQEASSHATEALWLASDDPRSGLAAARLLAAIDPAWARRRMVAVHVFADADVRADPDWPVRVRLLFRQASIGLGPALGVAFVPVSLAPFSSAKASNELAEIDATFRLASRASRAPGIVAGLTERPPSQRRGPRRLGQADLLGRHMLVRLEPGATQSRTLLHEILHLYGGVHISEPVESILNPAGDSLVLDSANRRIVALVRDRRFGAGGLQENLFPYVDLAELTAAYSNALQTDLGFRRLGVLEARASARESRYIAARKAREATALDPHLADVARLLAILLVEQGRVAEAANLLEVEARLRGPGSARGRAAARKATALRSTLPAPK